MLIKVCGMKDTANMAAVGALKPDLMGFIFYKPSPRYVGELSPEALEVVSSEIRKVAVFVDEALENILFTVARYNIDTVQLHGRETPELCQALARNGLKVIKAVGIEETVDVEVASVYEHCCDSLLFDTKSPTYGGTGRPFDWNVLEYYRGNLPFLLSGGIAATDIGKIKRFQHPRFSGIDVNSRFEVVPGIKDTHLLGAFIRELRSSI